MEKSPTNAITEGSTKTATSNQIIPNFISPPLSVNKENNVSQDSFQFDNNSQQLLEPINDDVEKSNKITVQKRSAVYVDKSVKKKRRVSESEKLVDEDEGLLQFASQVTNNLQTFAFENTDQNDFDEAERPKKSSKITPTMAALISLSFHDQLYPDEANDSSDLPESNENSSNDKSTKKKSAPPKKVKISQTSSQQIDIKKKRGRPRKGK